MIGGLYPGSWYPGGAGDEPVSATLGDLTTLFVRHLWGTLYQATPTDDVNTLLARDIPVVRADGNSLEQDLNTDYAKYLS